MLIGIIANAFFLKATVAELCRGSAGGLRAYKAEHRAMNAKAA